MECCCKLWIPYRTMIVLRIRNVNFFWPLLHLVTQQVALIHSGKTKLSQFGVYWVEWKAREYWIAMPLTDNSRSIMAYEKYACVEGRPTLLVEVLLTTPTSHGRLQLHQMNTKHHKYKCISTCMSQSGSLGVISNATNMTVISWDKGKCEIQY